MWYNIVGDIVFTEIIKNWFDENGDLIDYSNRSFYLILLFEELVENGLHNNDIISISKEILKILEKDFIDDSLFLLDQRRIAEEISYVYSILLVEEKRIFSRHKIIRQCFLKFFYLDMLKVLK